MTTALQQFDGLAPPRHLGNPRRQTGAYPEPLRTILGAGDFAEAAQAITGWPGYAPTPLHPLPGLAAALGVASVHYKDESTRFGLGSFKALGGAYAVLQLLREQLSERLGRPLSVAQVRSGELAAAARAITVVTATDGNHGRSVAWGAREFGCACKVYLHAQVSAGRAESIACFGAQLIRIDGDYDDSVRQAAADAAANGWYVVSDTSYPGYLDPPRRVMAGYGVMAQEVVQQLGDARPSHCLIQGGCGGLAAGVGAALWQRWGELPRTVILEPVDAACLMASAAGGAPAAVEIERESVMAGLSCGEVSLLAWDVVSAAAADFMTLEDAWVAPAMRLLARGLDGDPRLVAGETGVVGAAALIAACRDPQLRQQLGLDGQSRVLLFGTEGATDPAIYADIVGEDAPPAPLHRHPPLRYAGVALDRAAQRRKDTGWLSARLGDPHSLIVPVWCNRNLIEGMHGANPRAVALAPEPATAWTSVAPEPVFLGLSGECAVFSVDVSALEESAATLHPDAAFVDLRVAGPLLGRADAALCAYARGMHYWHRHNGCCSECGQATRAEQGGGLRRCPACDRVAFPRTDPAVIMLVVHQAPGQPDRCLLGRDPRWPAGTYSTLAGFVEPGESLEEAVAREVFEETGVEVHDVRYMASQPWPFPASIMLGFHASAARTELTLDPEEVEDARWFSAEEIRAFGEWGDESAPLRVPRRDSIARYLLDTWLASQAQAPA